jgi:phenylacetate-CoA ligase
MEGKFWNEQVETMSRDELRDVQWTRLKKQMRYIYYNSDFYREQFREVGAHPDDIKSIDDFRTLPIFLDKERDRLTQEKTIQGQSHPFGEYLCSSPKHVRALHTTSGTTGMPVFEAFSAHDIEVQNEVLSRSFWRMGWRPGDYVIHGVGLSMWLAGLMTMRAIQSFGAVGIPAGAEAGTERFLQFAKLTNPDHMCSFPSFVEHLARKAPEVADYDVKSLGLKTIMCGGEPGAGVPETRKKIEEAYGARLYDCTGGNWGLWGVSCDAPSYQGIHLAGEDYCLIDLVDPETKQPVDLSGPVVQGEWVLTALEWESGPAFRYAYGDIVQLMNEPCECGMPGMRMRYIGRADDLLIVKSVNVYPMAIKAVIDGFVPRVTSEMRIILKQKPPKVEPPLEMKVEYGLEVGENEREALKKEIEAAVSARLRIRPNVELVPPNSLERDPAKKLKLVEKQYE